ncbi:hypothetical protein F5B18DRAFT_649755 [Nemania serpens]|nr:hypothetical protein F5B18DRAFT_649755 [Nemania serpens]
MIKNNEYVSYHDDRASPLRKAKRRCFDVMQQSKHEADAVKIITTVLSTTRISRSAARIKRPANAGDRKSTLRGLENYVVWVPSTEESSVTGTTTSLPVFAPQPLLYYSSNTDDSIITVIYLFCIKLSTMRFQLTTTTAIAILGALAAAAPVSDKRAKEGYEVVPTEKRANDAYEVVPTEKRDRVGYEVVPTEKRTKDIYEVVPTEKRDRVVYEVVPTEKRSKNVYEVVPTEKRDRVDYEVVPTEKHTKDVYEVVPTEKRDRVDYEVVPTEKRGRDV